MISRLERELLDAEIDLSECVISDRQDNALSVRTRIGRFRIFLSLVTGIPCAYLLYILLRAPTYSSAAIITALVCAPFLAAATALFGFTQSGKAFDRAARQARLSLRVFGYERGRLVSIPTASAVRLSSEWGNEDNPAIWFRVDIEGRQELGFCVAWRYQMAKQFAQRLAEFLSCQLIDQVSADHRLRARDTADHHHVPTKRPF
ncbi:MAG: hypothetical protein ACRENP_16530 [Longimicrobiales bacterium]